MPPKNARAPAGKNSSHQRGKVSKSLREIYEEGCREHGVHPNSTFAKLLPVKQGVTIHDDTLDLSRNYLGDRGIIPVAAVVQRCPNVKRLVLSENGLRNNGVKSLSAVLVKHVGITSLDLSDNYISHGALGALEHLLLDNPRVVELSIANTKFEVDARLRLKDLAAANLAKRTSAMLPIA
jgi:hypothetical protein